MRPELKRKLYIGGCVAAAVIVVILVLLIIFGGGKSSQYQKHYDAAERAFLKQDYTEAIRELDKALDLKPTEEAYLLMARSYASRGDKDMAIQVLYLGYSRLGGENINAYLRELKGDAAEMAVIELV